MTTLLRLTSMAAAVTVLMVGVECRPSLASSAIHNEPGDPYNRPVRLPKPNMICVIGANPPSVVCPSKVASPLSQCSCRDAGSVGLRYFVSDPHRMPTVYSIDGFAW